MLRAIPVEITTATDGSATDYTSCNVTGRVVGIKYAYGTLAATTDLTITGETSLSPILTVTDLAQANVHLCVRTLPVQNNDGSAFTDATGDAPLVYNERIKIVTAQGGDTKTGTVTFYLEDENFVG